METRLIKREPYSKFLEETIGDKHIKIITGVRRAEKSTLLLMLAQYLKETGISKDQIIELNFELFKYSSWTVEDLYHYILNRSKKIAGKNYLYFLMRYN